MSPTERLAIIELEERILLLEQQMGQQDSRTAVERLQANINELRNQIALLGGRSSVTLKQAENMTEVNAGGDIENVATEGSGIVKTAKTITGGIPPWIVWVIVLCLLVAVGWITKDEVRHGLGFGDPVEEIATDVDREDRKTD